VAWVELDNVSCGKWLSEVESCVWQSWLSIGGSLRGCMVPGRTFEMSLWRCIREHQYLDPVHVPNVSEQPSVC
jgi:hypothetical protein